MELIQIGVISDVKDNKIFESHVNGEVIILVKSEDNVKALSGVCPHRGAQLSQGMIENGHVICPMHGKRFSCDNGVEDQGELCLHEYEIVLEDGKILFDKDQIKKNVKNLLIPGIREIEDLPKPKGHFITGNLSEFNKENKHQVLENWAKELGELFQFSLMGQRFLVSTSTDFNSQVLKDRPYGFKRFSKVKEVMDEIGIEGVFTAEGTKWKQHRKITAEALSLKNVKAYFPVLKQVTERLYRRWNDLANNERAIDIQQEMMLFTVDITTRIAFGYDTNTLESDSDGDTIQNHLKNIFPMVEKRITAPFPLWRYFKTKKDKELDASLSEIKKAINEIIKHTKQRFTENPGLRKNPRNFLEALLVEQEKEVGFMDKDIFGNVFTLLLAGEDTTSNSISWAMYYLALHPEAKQKLHEEVDRVLGNEKVALTIDQLDDLKYTEAVALEALRINPATPFLVMQANEEMVIQDLKIPKDTTVFILSKIAQTDPRHFSDHNNFMPDRWMAKGCPVHGNHNPDVMLVFGAGPRYCPGRNLAIQEMKSALAMVCKNFDFELAVKPEEVKEILTFTMSPKNLKMKIFSRNPVTG